jgi:hypothetical protein
MAALPPDFGNVLELGLARLCSFAKLAPVGGGMDSRGDEKIRSWHTIRCLVPWVLGVYFISQVAGLAQLAAVHFHHVHQSQVAIADDVAKTGVVDRKHEQNGHHQHGTADPGDQCCTLHHHLAAVLPLDLTATPPGIASASLVLPLLEVVAGFGAGLPDRPPKLLLSV